MLGFFPKLYPGELLYSAIARYQIRSGNLSPKLTVEELFSSRNITATADLPCGLDNLVNNLPPYSSITVENLIRQHTLYPYYAPFLPPKRARQIQASMKGINGGDIHTRAGIMASAISTPQYFRFCSECLQEDLEKYGETYWHRLHQIPGVLFCPTHKIPLQNSLISIQGSNKHEYYAASEENCQTNLAKCNYSQDVPEKLILLGQNISNLLQNNYPCRTKEWFTKKYKTLLIEKRYANATGRVKQKKLIDDFIFFYGKDFLETANSIVDYANTSNWLFQIVRKHRKMFHPIRHLLMIYFLTDSINGFFQNNQQYKPFGKSPWLCLNAAAPHYLQPVVTDLKVTHCLENKKPLGTFTCSCGMIYSRSGEDKNEEDRLKIGRVITYGRIWEDRLKELVEVKKLGLRATARELRVDPNTIKRYVSRLNLIPTWTKNKIQSKPQKTKTTDKHFIEQQRNRWLNLQQENPHLSKTELRKLAPDLYIWLYRHDKPDDMASLRPWLDRNSPSLKQPKPSVDRVDWNQRDSEILAQVQSAVNQLLQHHKPVRITIGKMGAFLGMKALLEKHLDKLPQTKAYLESVTENIEDYQIRRIEWAVKELNYRGEEVKEWRILKVAGLKENLSDNLSLYLERRLNQKSN